MLSDSEFLMFVRYLYVHGRLTGTPTLYSGVRSTSAYSTVEHRSTLEATQARTSTLY
jgi:hypothetical protein